MPDVIHLHTHTSEIYGSVENGDMPAAGGVCAFYKSLCIIHLKRYIFHSSYIVYAVYTLCFKHTHTRSCRDDLLIICAHYYTKSRVCGPSISPSSMTGPKGARGETIKILLRIYNLSKKHFFYYFICLLLFFLYAGKIQPYIGSTSWKHITDKRERLKVSEIF